MKRTFSAIVVLVGTSICEPVAFAATGPSTEMLSFLVGERIGGGIGDVRWAVTNISTNLAPIHKLTTPVFDEKWFAAAARFLGFTNTREPLPWTRKSAPGYWIREQYEEGSRKDYHSITFSEKNGSFAFGRSPLNFPRDPVTKKPAPKNVPSREFALQRAFAIMEALNISTNDLSLRENGDLRVSYVTSTVGYMERDTRKQVTVPYEATITFCQKIPGGHVYSVNSGGLLRFDFISDARISGIEWFRRGVEPAGAAKPRSRDEITRMIRNGEVYSWKESFPTSLTVTNCVVGYPIHSEADAQNLTWPFYWLTATSQTGGNQSSFYLFVPFRFE